MSGDLSALKQFLGKTPFFGGLDERQLGSLVEMLVERVFPAGSFVFREGESGRSMYIILSGLVLSCREGKSGRLIKLVRMGPGSFFGETTLIEMQPRPTSVRVEQDACLFELTNNSLYQLYQQDVKAYVLVLQNINRELCRRLRRADARLTEVADLDDDPVTQIRTRDEIRNPGGK
jgi:CRP-like cAMP-binding protein